MGTPRLSVAIITQNEEANLRRILPVVSTIADEIVIVDSGSTDGTIAVAESFHTRVVRQSWLGFGPQKNFAIRQCASEWVLSLDADELPSEALVAAIRPLIAMAPLHLAGFMVGRRNLFLGRAMRHGGMYPDRKLRLFRYGRAWFEERAVHESMVADGPAATLPGELLHDAYPSLALYIEHMNRYSSAASPAKTSRSLPAFLWNTVANPFATFAYNYLLRGGFLDGREGLLQHMYHSAYVSWKYAKAWEQANQKSLLER